MYTQLSTNLNHSPRTIKTVKVDWNYIDKLHFEYDEEFRNNTGTHRYHHPIGKRLMYEKRSYYSEHRRIDIPKLVDIDIPIKTRKIIDSINLDWKLASVYKYVSNVREDPHRINYPYPTKRYVVSNVDTVFRTCGKEYFIEENRIFYTLGVPLQQLNSLNGESRLTIYCWDS